MWKAKLHGYGMNFIESVECSRELYFLCCSTGPCGSNTWYAMTTLIKLLECGCKCEEYVPRAFSNQLPRHTLVVKFQLYSKNVMLSLWWGCASLLPWGHRHTTDVLLRECVQTRIWIPALCTHVWDMVAWHYQPSLSTLDVAISFFVMRCWSFFFLKVNVEWLDLRIPARSFAMEYTQKEQGITCTAPKNGGWKLLQHTINQLAWVS